MRWVVLLLVAAGCGGDETPAREPKGPDFSMLDADQVMVDVEHYMTREGVRRAHLRADTVYLQREGSVARLRHYTVDFFDGRGGLRSVLEAEDGTYDMQSGDMKAAEDVLVVDADQAQRLRTDTLQYDASSGKLTSQAPFTLIQGRDTVRGTGFVTDPGLDTLTTRQPEVVSPAEETPGGTDTIPPPRDTPPRGTPSAEDTSPLDTAGARRDPGGP